MPASEPDDRRPAVFTSPYLTLDEAAAYVRLAVQTLRNHRREIRAVRARPLLFRREDLDAWLAAPRHRRARRKKPADETEFD